MIEVGTILWADGGFGSVTWVGPTRAGVAFLRDGVPSVTGHAPVEVVEAWAGRWRDVLAGGLVVEVVD